MSKRKIGALQRWRAQYALQVGVIRNLKVHTGQRRVSNGGHVWGDFKRPAAQSLLAQERKRARQLMDERHSAAAVAGREWAKRQRQWEAEQQDKADQKHDAQMAEVDADVAV